MKVLHTSDWHLGCTFGDLKRYEEHQSFLNWLVELIVEEDVSVLLVAGDVFDNGTPSNQSKQQYYQFLGRLLASPCRHVVITGGNHDSPTNLNAPRDVLKYLNIHVVGSVESTIEEEVLLLDDDAGNPALIVCAVPFLRDRDVRTIERNEDIDDKTRKLAEGIQNHYHAVLSNARQLKNQYQTNIPIVAMGHLFLEGGTVIHGDGTRELYLGNLVRMGAPAFPDSIDYFALGHLHAPQSVKGKDNWRYSGSPLPIGFPEGTQEKHVVVAEFQDEAEPTIRSIPVPVFRRLITLTGGMADISGQLTALGTTGEPAIVDVMLTDAYPGALANESIRETAAQFNNISIRRVRTESQTVTSTLADSAGDSVSDLDPPVVFQRYLEQKRIAEATWPSLIALHEEILQEIFSGSEPEAT